MARAVSSNPDAYVYLAESIRAWPDQAGAGRADRLPTGWSGVAWRNLTGGIVALHRATRVVVLPCAGICPVCLRKLGGIAVRGDRRRLRTSDGDAAELIAELRNLAGDDPAGDARSWRRSSAALDRVAGGALRDELPEAIRRDTEHVVGPGRPEAPTR